MAQQNKDTNELIKVRRQNLADLQAAGKNPFEIMKYDVTHHSKEIKDNFEELEGKEATFTITDTNLSASVLRYIKTIYFYIFKN